MRVILIFVIRLVHYLCPRQFRGEWRSNRANRYRSRCAVGRAGCHLVGGGDFVPARKGPQQARKQQAGDTTHHQADGESTFVLSFAGLGPQGWLSSRGLSQGPSDRAPVPEAYDLYGDVVAATALIGQGHERLSRFFRGMALDDIQDLGVGDVVGQTVRAQHETIVLLDPKRWVPYIDLHRWFGSHRAQDDILLGMALGLFLGQEAIAHHLGDLAVVIGQLQDALVSHQIDPGVANMGIPDLVAGGRQGAARRTHPPKLGV